MRFHFYHKDSGKLHNSVVATNLADEVQAMAFANANAPRDHIAIHGEFDPNCQRIDPITGKAEDYQPPQPSADHEWDDTSKRWKLSAEAQAAAARKVAASARIAHLEANVQPRALREMALSKPGAIKRLQDIDDEIAELRKCLV